MARLFRRPAIAWITLICFMFTSLSSFAATPLPVPPRGSIEARDVWADISNIANYLHGKIDTSQFSIENLARQLQHKPVAIYNFVRQQVQFEAYAGAMRGAQGTLEGKAGNSLDQSLLLASLLKQTQVRDIRIVVGRLNDQQADRLIRQMFAAPHSFLVVPPTTDISNVVAKLARTFHTTEESIQYLLAENAQVQRNLMDRMIGLAEIDATLVAAQLYGQDPGIMNLPTIHSDDLRTAVKEHYWVRITNRHGNEIDLDPSFSDIQMGTSIATAARQWPIDQLGDLIPRAQLQLVLERLKGQQLETEVLWEKQLTLPALTQSTVQFSVIPSGINATQLNDGETRAADLLRQIDTSETFQPVVQLHGRQEGGYPFDMQGNKREVASGGGLLPFNAIGNVLGGIFGGGGSAPKSHLSGLKWVFKVDHKHLKASHESVVFDRLAAGSRSEPPKLLAEDEVSVKRGLALSGEVLVTTFVRNREKLTADILDHVATLKDSIDQIGQPDGTNKAYLRPAAHTPALQALVETGMTAMGYQAAAVRAYYAGPRMLVFLQQMDVDLENTKLSRSFDIVANEIRIVANPEVDGALTGARVMGLEFGALETLLEAWMLGGARSVNTHNIFRKAVANGTAFKVFTPENASAVSELAASTGAKVHIGRDLTRGHWVIVPAEAVAFDGKNLSNHWRYDLKTGILLGRGENGTGQAFVEYLTPTRMIIGTFIGIQIGWLICAFIHDDQAKKQQCYIETVVADLAALLALMVVIPIVGPWLGMAAVMGAGIWIAAYGLATGNDLAVNIGIGFVAEPLGAIAFNELLPRIVGPGLRRMADYVRRASQNLDDAVPSTGGWRPALETVTTGGGTSAVRNSGRSLGDILEMTADRFDDAMGRSSGLPPSMKPKPWGSSFEKFLVRILPRSTDEALSGGEIGPIVRANLDPLAEATTEDLLPQMRRVIAGQYNAKGWGADIFAVDNRGRLWVIEAKGNSKFGGMLKVNGNVKRAGNNPQMSKEWRQYAGEALANTDDGLSRIRDLMEWDNLSDAAVRKQWADAVENAEKAIVIPEREVFDMSRLPPDLTPGDVFEIRF